MSSQCEITAKRASTTKLGWFERYLTAWVFLCIVAGIVLGHWFPVPFQFLGRLEVAQVNLPVAILIWLMIVPMLLKIDFGALHRVKEHWKGVGVTLFVNWAVKPFSMALLGWIFIRGIFADWLPPEQIDSYIAGLILLAAAPCTAMVFVWSNLSDGEPHFTLTQVALNDTIMIFAFAPIVGLLLGLSAIAVPWDTLFLSCGALHRYTCIGGAALATLAVAQRRRSVLAAHAAAPQPDLAAGAADHPRAAVWLPG